MGNIDRAIIKRMHTLDVCHEEPVVSGPNKKNSVKELHQVGQELYNSFGRELLQLDLNRHKLQQKIMSDTNLSTERRYYVSTQARRMFKRLMVATKMDATSISTVEIASELVISHKAAVQLIDDALGFKVIDQIEIHDDVCEQTGITIKSKQNTPKYRYAATEAWMNSFLNHGCLHAYEVGEDLARARTLYGEFHRFVELGKINHVTGVYDMWKYRIQK